MSAKIMSAVRLFPLEANINNKLIFPQIILSTNAEEQKKDLAFSSNKEFHPLNINKLLFGSTDLTFDQNCLLFEEVQTYIKNTKRCK